MDDRVEIKDLELGTPTDNDLLVFQSVSNDECYKAPKSDLKGDKGDKGDTGAQGIQGIQGIQGVKGDKGDTGDNATADAGTTTTLPAGQSATVTNVGTTSDAIFNFAIPQGIKGDNGACLESVAFVGNDMVFTLDDESTVTLVNAKLDLKGDTGDTGASIVSASFVGNDLVFVKDDSSTVTLTNAKVILTGPQGATGDTGATGKGITTITKTGTVGLVDTYTITYSDSTTSTFDVTNGADGTDGVDGISYIWKGTYDAGTSYSANDCVAYLGTSYIYINVTPGSGHTPADDTYWDILALKGTDGVGTGDVLGPATNTADYIPQWDGANSKTLKNGIPTYTFAPALGADDNYVTNAEKIIIGNTSGTNTGDNATNTTSNSYADAKVIDSIADSDTTHAPSRNSVYDALALKSPIASPTFTGTVTMPALAITASDATGNLATITNTDATNYSRIKYVGTVNSFSSGVGNGSATITDLVNKFYIYDFTNTKVAMTIVPNTLATKFYGSLETVENIELGHATDTTLSRVSAGVIAVEGKTILTTDNIEDSIVDGHTTIAPSGNAVYDALALKLSLAGGTMTGDLTIGDAKQVILTAPSTDATCTGFSTSAFNSGYSSTAVGDLVYLDSSATWQKVDADAIATCGGMLGIALEVKASGNACKVALAGSFVRLNSWNWTVGQTLYASETAGGIATAIPTGADGVVRVIGWAVNADYIYFMPSSDNSTVVA